MNHFTFTQSLFFLGNNVRQKANKPFSAPKMRGESDDKDSTPSFKVITCLHNVIVYSFTPLVQRFLKNTVGILQRKPLVEKARHNPDAVGAIVMPRPGASHQVSTSLLVFFDLQLHL